MSPHSILENSLFFLLTYHHNLVTNKLTKILSLTKLYLGSPELFPK